MFNHKAMLLALLMGMGLGFWLEAESFGQRRGRRGRGATSFAPQKRMRPQGRQQFSAPSSRNSSAVSRRSSQGGKQRSPRINQFRASRQPRATGQGFSGGYGPQNSGYLPSTGLNPRSDGLLNDVQIIPQHRRPYRNPIKQSSTADVRQLPHVDFVGEESVPATREWVDNTGTFTIAGRLVSILGDKIRIIKENGHTTTVPLRRLSRDDVQYLEHIVSSHESDES